MHRTLIREAVNLSSDDRAAAGTVTGLTHCNTPERKPKSGRLTGSAAKASHARRALEMGHRLCPKAAKRRTISFRGRSAPHQRVLSVLA